MILKLTALLALTFFTGNVFGQSARRWAVVEANAPATRSNPLNVQMEAIVTDRVTARLAGRPGIVLIDRATIDKIMKEQIFQNGDRSSTDTAVQIGKLLGASQMIFVSVYDSTWSTHPVVSGGTTVTTGTIVLRATSRIIDVLTGVILAQPSSDFQDSVEVSRTSSNSGFTYGAIRIPASKKSSGGDPKVIEDNERSKAVDLVAGELADKLISPASNAQPAFASTAASAHMTAPLVAGINNGSVYINQGSNAGIKTGDQFQIVRDVNLGFNDPNTGQPMTEKQNICVLTIVKTSEGNSSGTCSGGTPLGKDVATPMRH